MRSAWRQLFNKLLPLALIPLPITPLPTHIASAPEPFTIYIAPHGLRTNDGLSPARPVGTLESAEFRLAQHDVGTDVEIRIAPGTYTVPQTRWQTYVPGHSITFLPYGYDYSGTLPPGGRPVFQSDGSAGYWFWANLPAGSSGTDTRLRFYYLEARGYSGGGLAIVGPTTESAGQRLPAGAGMNRNVVYGMMFDENGSLHNGTSTGYGGLSTWNSSHNIIQNNHFARIENAQHEFSLIHGIYLAHGSSHNLIQSNSFRYTTGHPINVRNDSNDNMIRENHFESARFETAAYYADWSCGKDCAVKYDKPLECPSHGNEFKYNTLISTVTGGWMTTFLRRPGGPEYIGPDDASCKNDGQPWLVTAGNIRP